MNQPRAKNSLISKQNVVQHSYCQKMKRHRQKPKNPKENLNLSSSQIEFSAHPTPAPEQVMKFNIIMVVILGTASTNCSAISTLTFDSGTDEGLFGNFVT